jgi:predicted secreted hydrolase
MSKNSIVRLATTVLLLALLSTLVFNSLNTRQAAGARAGLASLPPAETGGGFLRAEGAPSLEFPRDHGPHPDFQTEWWYYTGNLQGQDGRRFGYQLTFFRRAALPPETRQERQSDWATEQIYLAHFTLTDVGSGSFYAFERFERGAGELAGATGEPAYSVWVQDWSVEQVEEDIFHLRAAAGNISLMLTMTNQKGITLQGDQGYSQKGPEPGNASIYYSMTRLESQGTVTIGDQPYPVHGLSWLDREISTSILSEGQIGWDWFALQFDNGGELMVYQIRRSDGSADPFSAGTYINPDGETISLKNDDFQIVPQGVWRSPHSGGEYPARWSIQIDPVALTIDVQPLLADQELNVSVVYWEGAVRVEGTLGGQAINGYGYAELTGYAQSLEGDL